MRQLLLRTVTSPRFDAGLSRYVSFFAAAMLLVVGFWKLPQMPLSEFQLLCGILLLLLVALQFVVIGLITPLSMKAAEKKSHR